MHGVIYSEYISQKYLVKCELVTQLMCVKIRDGNSGTDT
jgi:hypothetical protein